MAVTPDDIAGVFNALNIGAQDLAGMLQRLAPLDQPNRLTASRTLMVARHQSVREAQDAELGELDTQIAAVRAQADAVLGG